MATENRPSISLPQGHVLGKQILDGLPRPVDAFLGIPYALPPTGDRRFRPPVKVPPNPDAIIEAVAFGKAAPGKATLVRAPAPVFGEDCLTANVFRQSSLKSAGSGDDNNNVPVLVYIHGGCYNRGSASMHNTASMVAHSERPFVAVSFNYRLGSLGFLPSRLSAKEGALNLGLRDQILLLEWVRDNIKAFGGDPARVTLYGLSAGAHSVGNHLMNYKEDVAPLFHGAIIESGSPTSRAVRPPDAPIHEAQFADFLREAGVPQHLPEDEVFPFLRKQPEEVLAAAQITVWDKYAPSIRWPFQPVVDGDVIPRAPLETWKQGKWHKMPVMTGFTTNEGSLYVPRSMSTPSQFTEFWAELLPGLSADDLDVINKLYPDATVSDQYKETRPNVGAEFSRIDAAYSNYAYIAPARQTADLASRAGVPTYLFHWALLTDVEGGARHADTLPYATCDPFVMALSPAQAELARTYHAYLTNFIINNGNPNGDGLPKWKSYEARAPKAMMFGDGNTELIGGGVDVPAKFADDTMGRKETEWWWSKVDVSQQ